MFNRNIVIKPFQLRLTKERFNKSISLADELDLPVFGIRRIVSAKLVQYGAKAITRDFIDDGYIFHYINKDRRCSMRFNRTCGIGIVEVKNPEITEVVIDFELERYE